MIPRKYALSIYLFPQTIHYSGLLLGKWHRTFSKSRADLEINNIREKNYRQKGKRKMGISGKSLPKKRVDTIN